MIILSYNLRNSIQYTNYILYYNEATALASPQSTTEVLKKILLKHVKIFTFKIPLLSIININENANFIHFFLAEFYN